MLDDALIRSLISSMNFWLSIGLAVFAAEIQQISRHHAAKAGAQP
ncbi:MAG TPA: hypothetical protein VFM22_09615 [Castellaniella sp.]|nr:hypothetical protein [Castellaniella sp.]